MKLGRAKVQKPAWYFRVTEQGMHGRWRKKKEGRRNGGRERSRRKESKSPKTWVSEN